MNDVEKIVKEHIKGSREYMKKVTSSKRLATNFLIRAGILTKSGKRLAKPYR
ncbi:MAG: hypothetical protein NTW19_06810 [Planctomycetota bacterium]|nr:hypothetical protein [Planctomycetota bacterium]